MFTTGGQKFYLKDLVTEVVHDIQNSPYNFSVSTNQTNNITRFQIVFFNCSRILTRALDVVQPQINIVGATSYLWRVQRLSPSGTIEQTFNFPWVPNWFNFNNSIIGFPNNFLIHGREYLVSATTTVGDITYSVYNCRITLNSAYQLSNPLLFKSTMCGGNKCTGFQYSFTNTSIVNDLRKDIDIEVTKPDGFIVTFPIGWNPGGFSLNNTSYGLTPLIIGGTYLIRARVSNVGGVPLPWSATCSVTIASCRTSNPDLTTNNSLIKTYPNPFKTNFTLDLFDINQDKVTVKVYDMIGKLVEEKAIDTTVEKSVLLGDNYKTGIYNIVIQDGEEVKTQRVIKE
jgi:Secretion system C-terminal sorting domain